MEYGRNYTHLAVVDSDHSQRKGVIDALEPIC